MLVVDVARGVLLETRYAVDGQITASTRFADFVEVAGRWWATKVEGIDEDGHVLVRQSLKVEALDLPTFDAAHEGGSRRARGRRLPRRRRAEPARGAAGDPRRPGRVRPPPRRRARPWASGPVRRASGRPGLRRRRRSRGSPPSRGCASRCSRRAGGATSYAAHAMAGWRRTSRSADAPTASLAGLGARRARGLARRARAARARGRTRRRVWASPGDDADALVGLRSPARGLGRRRPPGFTDRARALYASLAADRPFDVTAVLARRRASTPTSDSARASRTSPSARRRAGRGPATRRRALFADLDRPPLGTPGRSWPRCGRGRVGGRESPQRSRVPAPHVLPLLRRPLRRRRPMGARAPEGRDSRSSKTRSRRGAGRPRSRSRSAGVGTSAPRRFRSSGGPSLGELALRLRALRRAVRPSASAWFVNDWRVPADGRGPRLRRGAPERPRRPTARSPSMPLPRLLRTVGWARRDASDGVWKPIVDGLLARWRATADEDRRRDARGRAVLGALPERRSRRGADRVPARAPCEGVPKRASVASRRPARRRS